MQIDNTGKTKGTSDYIPTSLIMLRRIAVAALVMILAIAISQILSILQFGTYFTIIKVLIYLIMIPCYLVTGILLGFLTSDIIVDLHDGYFDTSDRHLLTIIGIILFPLSIFTIINCFTIWAPKPLDGMIERIYDILGTLESTGLKLMLFMSVLYWGLFALMLLFSEPGDKCPHCGLYHVTKNQVLIDSKSGPDVYETVIKDTDTKVDVNVYNGYDGYGYANAVVNSKTPVKTFKSREYSETYQHTCKYCGYVFETVDKGRTKELVSEEVIKHKEKIDFRIH